MVCLNLTVSHHPLCGGLVPLPRVLWLRGCWQVSLLLPQVFQQQPEGSFWSLTQIVPDLTSEPSDACCLTQGKSQMPSYALHQPRELGLNPTPPSPGPPLLQSPCGPPQASPTGPPRAWSQEATPTTGPLHSPGAVWVPAWPPSVSVQMPPPKDFLDRNVEDVNLSRQVLSTPLLCICARACASTCARVYTFLSA